jgi:MFS family permease
VAGAADPAHHRSVLVTIERVAVAAPAVRPSLLVVQGAAALAAAMGIARFVYTPILPLMNAQAGLSPQDGAHLATANYAGYFVGAVATFVVPGLVRSRWAFRGALLALVASLALMPAFDSVEAWLALRFVAGVGSALVFVLCAGALFSGLRAHAHHWVGWAFSGVGTGIALSGAIVLALRTSGTWEQAWWWAAGAALACTVVAWALPMPEREPPPDPASAAPPAPRRWFVALLGSYFLEGIGYIIAGTFLVAAIEANTPGSVGTSAWVLVGLAAAPSAALWAWLSRFCTRSMLLVAALAVQAIGIAQPPIFGGAMAALVAAVLFGATFLGIAMMALALGNQLRIPGAVAILTTGYSIGQMLGPLIVTPLLEHGYRPALVVSMATVVVSALVGSAVRVPRGSDGQ